MKDSLKMVMLNAPKGGWGVSGNGRVGNRSLGTVNVNWAPREMTTSWVTGQSVYGRETESLKELGEERW